jgi:hypothetical protein
MTAFLVTYDLVGTDASSRNYDRLIKEIKGYPDWCRIQDSVWLVSTTWTAKRIFDDLWTHLHATDRLAVVELTGHGTWSDSLAEPDAVRRVLSG